MVKTFSEVACCWGVLPIVVAVALSGRFAIPAAIAFSACAFSACGDGRPFPDEAFRFMADFEGRSMHCRRGGRDVFAGLDFVLPPSGALVLTGPIGPGRSSLPRLVASLLPHGAGPLVWDGGPIGGAPGGPGLRPHHPGTPHTT